MSNNLDLRCVLDQWPYESEKNVRLVQGSDGRDILQVRLPLGIEQYELEGRPDGTQPHGCLSALDYQQRRLAEAEANGQAAGFKLTAEECAELFNEGILFYCRYLNLFQIKDWPRTVCDTARNLILFDFVNQYAARGEDQNYLEQWRPYVLRMNASARAMLELETGHFDAALSIVNAARQALETMPGRDLDNFKFERQRSLSALKALARQIEKARPVSLLEQLEKKLRKAIETQEFEKAALLRDQIRALRVSRSAGAPP